MVDLSSHGIVALVRDNNNKLLLLKDARVEMEGLWAPPHGRCENTDNTEQASVIREVKEETNLDVQPIRKILTQVADTKVNTVSFWLVKTLRGEITLDDESSEYGWFTLDEAMELNLYPGTKKLFTKLSAGTIKLD